MQPSLRASGLPGGGGVSLSAGIAIRFILNRKLITESPRILILGINRGISMPSDTDSNQPDDPDEHSGRGLFAWNLRHRRESEHPRRGDVTNETGFNQPSFSQTDRGGRGLSRDLADRLARAVKPRLRDLLKPPRARVVRKEEDIIVRVGRDGMNPGKADAIAREMARGLRRELRRLRERSANSR